MIATMCEQRTGRRTRIQTVLRVSQGEMYVGDILLDDRGRVWRHADTIPSDVVLKAMIAHTRHEDTCGTLAGRNDNRIYLWYVVGGLAAVTAGEDA
jgi:hypothetical protein